jgi:hypothetical protein
LVQRRRARNRGIDRDQAKPEAASYSGRIPRASSDMPLAQITLEQLRSFLLWSALLNYAVLLFATLAWVLAGDALYRLHARWLPIERAHANTAIYLMLGLFKLGIWLLFLAPWLALGIVFPGGAR